MSDSEPGTRVVLVPLKRFDTAKSRLRNALSDDEVTELTIRLAQGVLEAARPLPTVVVYDDEAVADFARRCRVDVFLNQSPSLNGSVSDAYHHIDGYNQFIIVHGDLSRPHGLGSFEPDRGVTIITDHHRTGTNVLSLPAGLDFHFSYGKDSARAHQQEAARLGLPLQVVTDSPWRFDVDEPGDLQQGLDNT
jgi:2-phospho-L-lactate/phosphoenolpyruvate guanylyltransferase